MTAKSTSSDGPHEGWMQSSTCRAVEEAGRTAGREYGLAEATSRALVRLLSRQAKQKFGSADPAGRATLDALAQAFACKQLEELAGRLVATSSWAEWLAGVAVPPPAAGLPDYTKNPEIDFEPSGPSIDTHMKAGLKGGGQAIIHLRIQKWYQPDLDRHLFEESRKLERKFGTMPMVFVFLMWPPAEGPGMTGRFEERDAKGKVKRVFEYTIRRTWEIEPEEVTHSPGTMILAPLTKGSKQRMPEIVQMIKKGLDQGKVDAKTREMVWDAVYWSMGLICDLDEAHRALGDVLPFIHQSRNYLSAKGQAFMNAYSEAQGEGPPAAARTLVLRQATRRFGELPGAADTLAAITAPEDLEALAQRVLTAADWPSLFAGLAQGTTPAGGAGEGPATTAL
jgi:hypothetical protein